MIKRYLTSTLILIALLGIAGWIVWTVVSVEQRRTDYERNVYRAVDYCNLGHMEGVLVSLTAAKQLAINDDEVEYANELVRRFRKQDCALPTRVS